MQRLFSIVFFCFVCLTIAGCASLMGAGQSESDYKRLDFLYKQAEAAYAAGQMDKADSSLKEMLKIDPKENRALYRMGTVKFRLKKFDVAARYFASVIENDPRHSRAHYNLATIRLIQAEDHFKYFTATTDPQADVEAISKLLGAIEDFAGLSAKKKTEEKRELEISVDQTLPQEFGAKVEEQ